jgi:hypothetical protein
VSCRPPPIVTSRTESLIVSRTWPALPPWTCSDTSTGRTVLSEHSAQCRRRVSSGGGAICGRDYCGFVGQALATQKREKGEPNRPFVHRRSYPFSAVQHGPWLMAMTMSCSVSSERNLKKFRAHGPFGRPVPMTARCACLTPTPRHPGNAGGGSFMVPRRATYAAPCGEVNTERWVRHAAPNRHSASQLHCRRYSRSSARL